MNHSITISSLISSIPINLPTVSQKYIDEYNYRIDILEKELWIDLIEYKIYKSELNIRKTKYSIDREAFLKKANALKQFMYKNKL